MQGGRRTAVPPGFVTVRRAGSEGPGIVPRPFNSPACGGPSTRLRAAALPLACVRPTAAPARRRAGAPRARYPTSAGADRRANGPAGQLAVVVQPPQQQPLFLAGRQRQPGGPAPAPPGPGSCIERCTAVSYVRISRVSTSIRFTRNASRAAGPAGLRELTDLTARQPVRPRAPPTASPGRSPADTSPRAPSPPALDRPVRAGCSTAGRRRGRTGPCPGGPPRCAMPCSSFCRSPMSRSVSSPSSWIAGDPRRRSPAGRSNIPAGGRHALSRQIAPSAALMSARGGASAGCRCSAATRPGIRSITSVQLSGSAAISRGTRTGGRCRTNERYAAISCRNRSAHDGGVVQ